MKSYFLFVMAMFCCCFICHNTVAQKAGVKCKPGFKEDENGVCQPIKGKSSKGAGSSAKTCTISINLGINQAATRINLFEVKSNLSKPEGFETISTTQGIVKQKEKDNWQAEFSDLNCANEHIAKPVNAEYSFDPPEKTFPARLKLKDTFTFTSRKKPAPTPTPTPTIECKESLPPKPIQLDAPISQMSPLTLQSNCQQSAAGKKYYQDHSLKLDVGGYVAQVTIKSETLDLIDFEMLQQNNSITCSLMPSEGYKVWRCVLLDNSADHILRIFAKNPLPPAGLSYQLSVKAIGLTKEGYDGRIDQIRLSLGEVPGSSKDAIINSLNRQLDSPNEEKLRSATESLEALEKLTEGAEYNRSMIPTLLALIYRYYEKNSEKAKGKETQAIERGGSARFKVMVSEKDEVESQYRHWLLIQKGEINLELLQENVNDKFLKRLPNFRTVKHAKTVPAKKTRVPLLIVEIGGRDKPYYLIPITQDKNSFQEVTAIRDLIIANALK